MLHFRPIGIKAAAMTDKEWLEYAGQSTAELLALAKTHREDSIVAAFETALSAKDKEALTEEERVVLAVEAMQREVSNGGFDQFFINPSAEYASMLVESLNRIGCPKTAAIALRAIHALGLRPPFAAEEVESSMQEELDPRRDQELDACDEAYNEAPEPIAASLLKFIQANAAKITLPASDA